MLEYNGKPMSWMPSRIHAISGGQPLGEPEPMADIRRMLLDGYGLILDQSREARGAMADIRRMLLDGYGLILDLQPGDATRYSVILTPLPEGFVLTATGGGMLKPLVCQWGVMVTMDMYFRNTWSNELLAWWAECLALQGVPA